jgi:hypothetical protein
MAEDLDTAIRCRNYAEELRLIAADKTTAENRETLLRIAEDYDRLATSFEHLVKSKQTSGLLLRPSI